jgi:ABC-type Fe3+/spermidine/putrescine transport system ATPase subunit
MTFLELKGITKSFGSRLAVHGVSFQVEQGEFFSILGPSGCGKTTLLRMIAGFETPDAGAVVLNGRDVTRTPPEDRRIGMVFQNYALFPHLNVFENVAFGLRVLRLPGDEIRSRVRSVLASVEMDGRQKDRVATLSGGEQQRIAVARALVIEPSLLLFDEPLSNLDVGLRQRTREEIRAIQRRTRITTVYVTHDQSEAMSLSHRMAIVQNGAIEQIGTPHDVYESPSSPFVARFLGWQNVFSGSYVRGTLSLGSLSMSFRRERGVVEEGEVTVAIPSDAIILGKEGPGERYLGLVSDVDYLGMVSIVSVEVHSIVFTAHAQMTGLRVQVGETVPVWIDWSRCRLFSGARE